MARSVGEFSLTPPKAVESHRLGRAWPDLHFYVALAVPFNVWEPLCLPLLSPPHPSRPQTYKRSCS